MEIELDPIHKAVSSISSAREVLFAYYDNPNVLLPIKEHIKQSLSKEVKTILEFFKNKDANLFASNNIQHHAKEFVELTKNRLVLIEIEELVPSKALPTPSKQDLDKFRNFFSKPCCQKLNCTSNIQFDVALKYFKDFVGLSPAEQDFFLYGQLQACSRKPKNHVKAQNDKIIFDYKIGNSFCCKEFYRFVNGMRSREWLEMRQKNVRLKNFEVIDQRGGSHNVIGFEERLKMHNFITNYLQDILLDDPKNGLTLLPASFSVQAMYDEYKKIAGSRSFSAIYQHFKDFWPNTRKIPSYSDYCNVCFVKRKLIDASTSEEEALDQKQSLDEHLEKARLARTHYRSVNIKKAKLNEEIDVMCLSFDWAQNWDLPKYQKQPGELYFLTRQRVGLFGVVNEKSDVQTFYCIPERELIEYSKGPNSTLSYFFHYLTDLPQIPKKLIIYMDNCGAQNKNNYSLWFYHWLVHSAKMVEEIEINFLTAGHTKFSPDRHFGYAKTKLNKEDSIETFVDVLKVIQQSSFNQRVVPVVNYESNKKIIMVYNWKEFLAKRWRKASNKLRIFNAHYFRVSHDVATIEYRKYFDSEPMFVNLLKKNLNTETFPLQMTPQDIPDSKREDYKNLEKFITSSKIQDFWKGIINRKSNFQVPFNENLNEEH